MTGRPKGAALVLRYAGFAVVATLANLGAQRLVLAGFDTVEGSALVLAMAVGTGVGLVVKYALDKRWIFYDRTTGARAQGAQFALYAAMGLVTTAIFWVTETVFWLAWGTDLAREAGAVLGLSVGYVTKYLLDRRFVFRVEAAA
ncbi:GtrA family protein [Roseicyclus marinus]|uniref:GtrA family protein n=1 Tax=Roseicyclus marinus TaxID=2161673 RepID=UPI002410AD78|nr:GtrA family protein [Roseicyclus marinus]MDG3042964.1 GtrA family protein [Roseicyclus marinus]